MRVIIINGFPNSGKSTFANLCGKYLNEDEFRNISTVDYVKEVAEFCGWEHTKTPEDRRLLSGLKQLLTNWHDIPFQKVVHQVSEFQTELEEKYGTDNRGLVFIHCREPYEIYRLVIALGAKTLIVKRPETDNLAQSNPSDVNVLKYDYDYTITNAGTLFDLENMAVDFLREIGINYLNVI